MHKCFVSHKNASFVWWLTDLLFDCLNYKEKGILIVAITWLGKSKTWGAFLLDENRIPLTFWVGKKVDKMLFSKNSILRIIRKKKSGLENNLNLFFYVLSAFYGGDTLHQIPHHHPPISGWEYNPTRATTNRYTT